MLNLCINNLLMNIINFYNYFTLFLKSINSIVAASGFFNAVRLVFDTYANLSHDLRTPLISILGYLQLSMNPECSAEKNDKAHAVKSMINCLYELSVLDIKETPLKKEELDLNLLLRDILAGQYELFSKLGIILNVNLPNKSVCIIGDRLACTRIIQNLLSNSTHYAKGNAKISLSK